MWFRFSASFPPICFRRPYGLVHSLLTLIATRDPGRTGKLPKSNHVPLKYIILFHMVYLNLFTPFNRLSTETEPSGITTRYNYKDILQLSAANIAVSFHCTRIEVIHPKNSSRSLAPFTHKRGFPNCSRRSLVPCPKWCAETDNVIAA
jgi:hypothetical protein